MLMRLLLALVFVAMSAAQSAAQARNLEIYWIDVDGGAATLIVAPNGTSLLVDTGSPGPGDRDALRIFEATKISGLKQIDSLITTHFHGDHAGGVPALAKLIPIGHFYDHGDSIEAQPRCRVAGLIPCAPLLKGIPKTNQKISAVLDSSLLMASSNSPALGT